MKIIPKKDLIILLEKEVEQELLTRYIFDSLFEDYGDDWYISDVDRTKYKLYNINEKRKKIIDSK